MAGGSGCHRYGAPEHGSANGRHRKDGELTTSRWERNAAFGMSSRHGVDGGGALWAQEDPAKLRVALASAFVLGRGRLSPAAVALGSGQRMGEEEGSAWRFIGRPASGNRKGSGRDWSPAMCG